MKKDIRFRTQLGRVAASLVLLNFAVPGGALVAFGAPLKQDVEGAFAKRAAEAKSLRQRRAKSASRLLTNQEERSLQGKTGENPYLAGQSKWDEIYKGVNLMTGNFSTSVPDLSFDGGYGIPVNVTRSYSANNLDEGPFGKGWTLSADVRSTAGGLMKSGTAPVRAVPVGFKERPSSETDPNAETATGAATQPIEAVVAIDASGDQETVQKDIDGILTTPPWDTNVNENTQYETITQSGAVYQLMTHNETVTGEGTRYVYEKEGSFVGGSKPWDNLTATAQPANVMKVVSATDRYGNITTYNYGTTNFTYLKSNGTTSEKPLIGVSMPGGHTITFTWGTTGDATGRLTSATDNSYPTPRSVAYQYTTGGLLWKVTSPALKTTTYGYGSSVSVVNGVNSGIANDLLTSITDPRGLTTSIAYYVEQDMVLPLNYEQKAVRAYKLAFPGGQSTYVFYRGEYQGYALGSSGYAPRGYPSGALPLVPILSGDVRVFDLDASGNRMNAFGVWANPTSTETSVNITPYQADYGYTQAGFGSPHMTSIKTYDVKTMNLVTDQECTIVNAGVMGVPRLINRHWGDDGMASQGTITSTSYNFQGKPLNKVTSEYHQVWSTYYWLSPVTTRTSSTGYSYWGPEKYYQQKAVRDPAGRYSFTDYYLNTDSSLGRRGQTAQVYDAKNGGIVDTADPINYPVPGYGVGVEWRYRVRPSNAANFSVQFDYDEKGRPKDVLKLLKTSSSPWTYVQTHTTYGNDGYPTWGQANKVVEDYGTGKINRTTETLAYTAWGKPSRVRDAAGHEFETTFDEDGQVQKVQRVDTTPVQDIVNYSYGATSGTVSYGQPTSITDGLSGVTQTIAYTTSGGGVGQPSSITETNGTDTYTVGYTYGSTGNRATTTYTTPNGGTTRWGYADYVYRGTSLSPLPLFQTMVRLDGSGNRTPEELHYDYTSSGQLRYAAFAQTPSASTPTAGTYYDANYPAASRGRATYIYDDGGRLTSLAHTWETSPLSSGSSTSDNYTIYPLLKNECDYELSGSNRALKTASRFYKQNPSATSSWLLERTESYGYDASLDYLTSANYGDGLANATPTWSYDAAGNRNDAVTDNLNRATSVGGSACTNDILGNRLTKNGFTLGWDPLNRLLTVDGFDPITSNKIETYNYYRADGMRVASERQSTQTLYRYDGQMGFEDEDFDFDYVTRTVTKYGIGARGIDFIERTAGSTVTTGFPMYDAHGNNMGTLSRSGSTYAVSDRRSYDAWGVVRAQQSAGDPTLRYCGNLGHKQDDETGLIYMRARYYEPSGGRFISEDPGKHGQDWFVYGSNNPVLMGDRTGCEDMVEVSGTMSLSSFMSTLGAQVNAIVLNGINGAARVGQAVRLGTPLAGLLAKLQENPEDWNYVESMAIEESAGVHGFIKAFVKMDADQVVMKWLITSEDEADNVVPHATPYFDPDGAPPGSGWPINPFS